MLNVDKIPENVMNDLRERFEDDHEEFLKRVANMSARKAFDEFLQWNGIIGYTGVIIEALDGLRKAKVLDK